MGYGCHKLINLSTNHSKGVTIDLQVNGSQLTKMKKSIPDMSLL